MRLKFLPRFVLTGFVLASALAPAQEAQTSPTPPKLEFLFQETVSIGAAVHVGETPLGARTMIPITGGTFSGPQIKGTIVGGGWDWQLGSKNGCTGVRADYMLRTDDGITINVLNRGSICGAFSPAAPAFTSPTFEAPLGKYDWLNRGAYIGTLEPIPGVASAVRIRFYRAVAPQ